MPWYRFFWTGQSLCPDGSWYFWYVQALFSGVLLSAVGIYQPFAEFAGAGASVPLLGFGNILWKGMKESIDKNGLIGLFMGGFTACAVGVSAALIFSYLASLIFKPKMKG